MTTTTTAWASSSVTSDLPSLGVLQTWVHRPQALARCTISDLYAMRALLKGQGQGQDGNGLQVGFVSRDVFMLNRFPCRMVELVGWVSGVDEKEKTQTVYLDDGDGIHILPVTIRLPLVNVNVNPASTSTVTQYSAQSETQSRKETHTQERTHFTSSKERKALRKAAFLESQLHPRAEAEAQKNPLVVKKKEKEYARNDIRVGDTARVRGRIEEFRRGNGEWVRQVVVEPGSGGCIEVVGSDQQYLHLHQVLGLHETLYSRPFVLPTTVPTALGISQQQNSIEGDTDMTFGTLDSTMISSEMTSEVSVDHDQVKLCRPSKLRSSQLTDRTFRQYLLDHITQETSRAVEDLSSKGESILAKALEEIFPEYRNLLQSSGPGPGRESQERIPLTSRLVNTFDDTFDQESTPRPRAYKSKSRKLSVSDGLEILGHELEHDGHGPIPGFTITSILSVPHLTELAGLVVDEQSRKEEKRRRRRIRDGLATPKDLSQGVNGGGWKLTMEEKRARMERLARWVIRGLSEEGVLVQVQVKVKSSSNTHLDRSDSRLIDLTTSSDYRTPNKTSHGRYTARRTHTLEEGYIPLPEHLLLPLLIPHLTAEMAFRRKIYIKNTDARYGNGVLLEEVLGRMRRFGEEGRWERLGEFCVEDALVWGEGRGVLMKVGKGWVVG